MTDSNERVLRIEKKIRADINVLPELYEEFESILKRCAIDPTEIFDLKTSLSEAVANSTEHGYNFNKDNFISITYILREKSVAIIVEDKGVGFVPRKEFKLRDYGENSDFRGNGLFLLNNLNDRLVVRSTPGKGTWVMVEKICNERLNLQNVAGSISEYENIITEETLKFLDSSINVSGH